MSEEAAAGRGGGAEKHICFIDILSFLINIIVYVLFCYVFYVYNESTLIPIKTFFLASFVTFEPRQCL